MNLKNLLLTVCCLLGCLFPLHAEQIILIPSGSQWKYFKGTQSPSIHPIFWRQTSFDDSSWNMGVAPFYYGGNITTGTKLSDMKGKYSTLYMRKSFILEDGDYDSLTAEVLCDDGFALWINGIEVKRENLPSGNLNYDTLAPELVTVAEWKTFDLSEFSEVLKPAQENVVAVLGANLSLGNSGDFAMDLVLKANQSNDLNPPFVTKIMPEAGRVVANPPYVSVTFNESVSNVENSSLLCEGEPAESLVEVSAKQYIFKFAPRTQSETVTIGWNPETKICDRSQNHNLFVTPTENWSYDVNLDAPRYDVVINEIMAVNSTTLRDNTGSYSDWIELYNQGAETVDLSGWYLTDSKKNLTKWQFPEGVILDAGRYLIVFCDGSTEGKSQSGYYHSNFSLSKEGEYLGLIYQDGETIVDEISPSYPPQRSDISYGQGLFYTKATPGTANGAGYLEPVSDVVFSEPRGYKSAAFELTLSTDTEGASIYYTLDGTVPTKSSALYTEPLQISKITTLRAIAVKDGHLSSNVATRTWLFMEEVLKQPKSTPAGWPASYSVRGHKLEYGMNSSIVNSTQYGKSVRMGLTNICTISMVTDLKNLFDTSIGIYVNQDKDGEEWERPASLELIDPSGGEEFQLESGIRIRGAASRTSSNPKHSFRFFFRSRYGGELHFPLFGNEGVSTFDKVDLRTSQNYSWAYEQTPYDTFIRETFCRDSQRDVGMPYTRSRYYHLYINGQYWGLYQTQERSETSYAESYLGGKKEDWDLLKTEPSNRHTIISEGTIDAFNNFYQISIKEGFSGSYATNYWRVKGMNPDGSVNPNFPVYLDEENLLEYMINVYVTSDTDSPISVWGGFGNNLFALYNRENPSGFKWFRHDGEHSLGGRRFLGYGEAFDLVSQGWDYNEQYRFNPMRLHQKLMEHPDYKMHFIDLLQKRFFDSDGEFSIAQNMLRWNQRMAELDDAIVVESARWGHGYTKEDWIKECNYVRQTFFRNHPGYLKTQLAAKGWLSKVSVPTLSRISGDIPSSEDPLIITAEDGVFCTTDGSDPRLPGGEINPKAVWLTLDNSATNIVLPNAQLSIFESPVLKIRAYKNGEWSAIREADFTSWVDYNDLKVTEMMYAAKVSEDAASHGWDRDDLAWIELQNTGNGVLPLEGVQFSEGITYTFPAVNLDAGQRIVLAKNLEAFASQYETNGLLVLSGYSGNLARKGETISLQDPEGANILTYTYSNKWYPITDQGGASLVVVDPLAEESLWSTPENWRASANTGGNPGHEKAIPAPEIGKIQVLENGNLCFSTEGIRSFVVEASRDLENWELFDSWREESGQVIIDMNGLAEDMLFFRIRI